MEELVEQEINLLKTSDSTLSIDDFSYIDEIVQKSKKHNPGLDLESYVSKLTDQEIYWLKRNEKGKWQSYLEYRFVFKYNRKNHIVGESPLYLLIEPTSVCNLGCPMCFQADSTFTTKTYMGMMDIELFKSAITEAKNIGVQAITLASRGEPTLHPKLIEMLDFMKGKFLDIKINTNGTKLTEEICRSIIENEVNEVVFSIDSSEKITFEKLRFGAKLEKVLENVQLFSRIRSEYSNHKTLLRISGVKILKEQDWDKFVDYWGPYFDQVGWVPAQARWDTYNNELSELSEPCRFLWERMYLWHDGTVNPCDVDYKSFLSPGKFPQFSLKQLWDNQVYREIRSNHRNLLRSRLSPCDRCGVC